MSTRLRINSIKLNKNQMDQLESWARSQLPTESCALLVGRFLQISNEETGEKRIQAIVNDIYFMKNIDDSSVSFRIDPEEHYKVIVEAQKKQMEIVAIYHSHPVTPSPSGVDLSYMKIHDYAAWVIRGITERNHEVKAYQLYNDQLIDVDIIIEK